jgi:hypothetical protein
MGEINLATLKLIRDELANLSNVKNFYIHPNIPPDKLEGAIENYCGRRDTGTDDVEALFDDTVFGNAKDGFIITADKLHMHWPSSGYKSFFFSDIQDVKLIDKYIWINGEVAMGFDLLFAKDCSRVAQLIKNIATISRMNPESDEKLTFSSDTVNEKIGFRDIGLVDGVKGSTRDSSGVFAKRSPSLNVVGADVNRLELIRAELAKVKGLDNFYIRPNIPPKKIANAVARYVGQNTGFDEVEALYDDTVFGSAKEGFVFTVDKLYVHELMHNAESLKFKTMNDIKFIDKTLWINSKRVIELVLLDKNDCQRLLQLLERITEISKIELKDDNNSLGGITVGAEQSESAMSKVESVQSKSVTSQLIRTVLQQVSGLENFYVHPNIPTDKLEVAISTFAQNLKSDMVEGLYDDTVFGLAEEGMIFSDDNLYLHEMFGPSLVFDFKKINNVQFVGNDLRINDNKVMSFRTLKVNCHNKISWVINRLAEIKRADPQDPEIISIACGVADKNEISIKKPSQSVNKINFECLDYSKINPDLVTSENILSFKLFQTYDNGTTPLINQYLELKEIIETISNDLTGKRVIIPTYSMNFDQIAPFSINFFKTVYSNIDKDSEDMFPDFLRITITYFYLSIAFYFQKQSSLIQCDLDKIIGNSENITIEIFKLLTQRTFIILKDTGLFHENTCHRFVMSTQFFFWSTYLINLVESQEDSFVRQKRMKGVLEFISGKNYSRGDDKTLANCLHLYSIRSLEMSLEESESSRLSSFCTDLCMALTSNQFSKCILEDIGKIMESVLYYNWSNTSAIATSGSNHLVHKLGELFFEKNEAIKLRLESFTSLADKQLNEFLLGLSRIFSFDVVIPKLT